MVKIAKDIYESIAGYEKYSSPKTKGEQLYPIDLIFTLDNEKEYYSPKDSAGIPIRLYKSVGAKYNPTRVAAFGLANWNKYKSQGNEESKVEFLKVVNWFMQNNAEGKWVYNFDWGELKAGWISCMAQGEAISILTRGYWLTAEKQYLNLAVKAAEYLFLNIDAGGVKSSLSDGSVFFEEYPSANVKHVLNGFLYAVIGLIELYNETEIEWIGCLLSDLKNTLEKNIHLWDSGYWSYYDLDNIHTDKRKNLSTIAYHSLHISQLRFIGDYFKSELIINTASKWQKYMRKPLYRLKALKNKILYRLKYRAQR